MTEQEPIPAEQPHEPEQPQEPEQPAPPPLPPVKKNKLRFYLIVLGIALVPLIFWVVQFFRQDSGPITNQSVLKPLAYQPLPVGSIKPKGWLLHQLKVQAQGLSGHLDEFWPDIAQSGWIGGKAEGWERGPYWLDGVVPLAVLTDDSGLKKKVKYWFNYILEHQASDGWLGPDNSPCATGSLGRPPEFRDPWPQFVILKAMAQYQEAFGDKRVIPAMMDDLHCLNDQLDHRPLFGWNFFRWGDLLPTLYWLYQKTSDPWLLDFGRKAASQGYDWDKHFADLPVKDKSVQWTWEGHVVNTAMGLKTPGWMYIFTGENRHRKAVSQAFEALDRYHGEPSGLFSGDECLAGRSPSQGTELCAVAETMFSLETLLSALGDLSLADRLEKIAFNALPCYFTPDYWGHQYDDQPNQVVCQWTPRPIYTTNNGEANLYGLEPHYGCCTANMHQAWPKFTTHLWMATPDSGLVCLAYSPCSVETEVNGVKASILEQTDYPFDELLNFQITVAGDAAIPIYFRVPSWTDKATLKLPDGKIENLRPGSLHQVIWQWHGTQTLVMELPMSIRVEKGYNNAVTLVRGPLIYSLPIREQWKAVQAYPYQPKEGKKYYWQVFPQSPWNYALVMNEGHPDKTATFLRGKMNEDPFTAENTTGRIMVHGRKVDYWVIDSGAAAPPPASPARTSQPLEDLQLVPYGASRLRVTEFPVLE